jgi:hypothetical protein
MTVELTVESISIPNSTAATQAGPPPFQIESDSERIARLQVLVGNVLDFETMRGDLLRELDQVNGDLRGARLKLKAAVDDICATANDDERAAVSTIIKGVHESH